MCVCILINYFSYLVIYTVLLHVRKSAALCDPLLASTKKLCLFPSFKLPTPDINAIIDR